MLLGFPFLPFLSVRIWEGVDLGCWWGLYGQIGRRKVHAGNDLDITANCVMEISARLFHKDRLGILLVYQLF